METQDIKNRIKTVIIKVLKHENFDMVDELTASDVDGWNSLTHMEIISGIEDEFRCKFKLRELNKLKNMGSLVELVQDKV